MKDWEKLKCDSSTTVIKVVEVIDKSIVRFAVIVDGNGKLSGTVTDGDIRRGLLRGVTLESPISHIMNMNPSYLNEGEEDKAGTLMEEKKILHVPIVDSDKVVTNVIVKNEALPSSPRDNPVVLMAGGFGKRLGKLTENYPKPLLKVGNRPILETILENYIEYGFHNFYFSVNFKSELIKDHFGDGSKWNVSIKYLNETEPLGTAGSLKLLPELKEDLPIFIMNGDLLTTVNFQDLMNYHDEREAFGTMGVREYDFQVPFGVVEIEDTKIKEIVEKPVHNFYVNAGVYVINPKALSLIPEGDRFDMTQLFNAIITSGKKTSVFPIREYWIDVGQIDDYNKANVEYDKVFPSE